jgi:regulator of sigma E protease
VKVIEVAPNSPAAQAGLQPGDMLLKINGQPVESMQDLQNGIYANLDKSTNLTYKRDGQVEQVTLTPRSNPPQGEGAIGIVMGNPTRPVGLLQAIPMGAVTVYDNIKQLFAFPVQLMRGSISPQEGRLVGFKGMFDIYQQVSQSEPTPTIPTWVDVMAFFATITVSLGVLNLLPIPALDGGRILFTLPEIVIGRRIPPQYENMINLVSFALLLMLLLYINLQDFINPITLPK